jgi:hypothetical protein
MQNQDLTTMPLEDLRNIEVTSVSRTEEKLSRTASAVFVIGPEDIRDWGERGSLSIVGQNLLQDHHFEFQEYLHCIDANPAKRSGYAMMYWSF